MSDKKVVIIGLGYVGLPLALSFCEYYKVIGFDNEIKKLENSIKEKAKTHKLKSQRNLKKYILLLIKMR